MNATAYRRLNNRQRGDCTWCGKQVPRGQRKWCGPSCVHEFLAAHGGHWGSVRFLVWKRDRGVCAACGCDTERLRNLVRRLCEAEPDDLHRSWMWQVFADAGWPSTYRDWWEADHIVSRTDGGVDSVANLRTLCVPCHKSRTAAWHRERTRLRRLAELRRSPHDHCAAILRLMENIRQAHLFAEVTP